MAKMNKYMVEWKLLPFSVEMHEAIPRQRLMIEQLFDQGILVNYTLAADRSKLWAVLAVSGESELVNYIESMPMTRYGDYDYKEIMTHDSIRFVPSISLN